MTDDEAKAEAVRRWGPDAQTEPYQKDYVQILIGEPRATWKGWPPRILVAWGKTWEETFANANAGQYQLPKRYYEQQNPPERTAEASRTPLQMRLFP